MSDFRKLLLAFAAVTLLAGIASAGPAPALNHTAQPLSVRSDAIAPEITQMNLKENPFNLECNIGIQTAPAFLVETSGTFELSAPQSLNIGSPALPPAPVISNNTAQATGHLAGTPANLNSNFSNTSSTHPNWTTLTNSTLNGKINNNHTLVVDVGTNSAGTALVFNSAAPAASSSAGQAVVATLSSAIAPVARTAPKNAGINAG